MAPTVSIIMPAYNAEQYIGRAIASALDQTFEDFELLIVDDASTDGTIEVVQSFGDSRIKLFVNSENMGAAVARNCALEAATGTWIAVLDSDDWYGSTRLETLLSIAELDKADMVADDLHYVLPGTEQTKGTLISQSGYHFEDVTLIDPVFFVRTDVFAQKGLHLGYCKPMIRRSFLEKHSIRYNPELRLGQDYWLYLDCLVNGASYYLLPEAYYFYRLRSNSLVSHSKISRLKGYCKVARAFLARPLVQADADLSDSIRASLDVYQKNISYYRVLEPLRRKKWAKALGAMPRNPYFFVLAMQRAQQVFHRYWTAYMTKDKHNSEARLFNH